MPKRDHFAITLGMHNVASLEGRPKRPKEKSEKGKGKEKSKWKPNIAASVTEYAGRSITTTPGIFIPESPTGNRRSSAESDLTVRTMSTIEANMLGLITPTPSSSSSASASSGGSGDGIVRRELGRYLKNEGIAVEAIQEVTVQTTSPDRVSRSPPSPAIQQVPRQRSSSSSLKIPPMPKGPPPPPPPTSPLPSALVTAPAAYFCHPSAHIARPPSIPIPKRPSTSPASGGLRYDPYSSSPENVLLHSHQLARHPRSPPTPRPRPTSSIPSSSVGSPPRAQLPPLPSPKPRSSSTSTTSSTSIYSNSSSELPYITSPVSTPKVDPNTCANAQGSTPSLNPSSAVMDGALESNPNVHSSLPSSSLLLTPPTTEMKVDKKPSPALMALLERQSRLPGEGGYQQWAGYPAHNSYLQQQQQQQQHRSVPIYTNTLRESPKSTNLSLSASPPRISPIASYRPSSSSQSRSAGYIAMSHRHTSPRGFTPTPLPSHVDEETASMLSLERRGGVVQPATEYEVEIEGQEQRDVNRALSALSFTSNASGDPRLSGLISSFPATPTSTTFSPVVPFVLRSIRRAPVRSGDNSTDDEGWE